MFIVLGSGNRRKNVVSVVILIAPNGFDNVGDLWKCDSGIVCVGEVM